MVCVRDEIGKVQYPCPDVCEDGACVNSCEGKICGEPCAESGICDSDENCFHEGGCLLTCEEPDPGSGDGRVWNNPDCGRKGSYKCGESHICGNSLTDCIEGGDSIEITGQWGSYVPPSGYFDVGDTFEIRLNRVSGSPGFNILAECGVIKPDGTRIYFNDWGSGDVTFSYDMETRGAMGTWTVDYCGLWSDFEENGGWLLFFDGTDHTFKVGEIL
jgi:hypothetical protein